MHLSAHLTAADFERVLAQLTPLRIALDADNERRFLALSPPAHVSLSSQGLRIVTDLQLQWDVVSVRFPVSMKRVSVLLKPSMTELDGQLVLLLGVTIEEADLSALPGFLESVLIDRVNDALARRDARIVWRFMETLDFSFRLPAQVRPRYRVRLYASSGTFRIEKDTFVLTVDWGLDTHPHESDAPRSGATRS